MDDTAIRVAVGLRLGCTLCKPHNCHHCGAAVDALATHGLSCKQSEGRHFRHSSLNALSAAKIPSRLEPAGMYRNDGKRPDGITMEKFDRSSLRGGQKGKEGGQKEEGEGEKRGGKFEYCNMNFVGYLANYS